MTHFTIVIELSPTKTITQGINTQPEKIPCLIRQLYINFPKSKIYIQTDRKTVAEAVHTDRHNHVYSNGILTLINEGYTYA